MEPDQIVEQPVVEEPIVEQPVVEEPVVESNNVQKRISKLTKKLADQGAEVEYWKQQALAHKAPQEQVVQDGKPILDNFETVADFTEALTDWKLEQKAMKELANAERDG